MMEVLIYKFVSSNNFIMNNKLIKKLIFVGTYCFKLLYVEIAGDQTFDVNLNIKNL